ncbi:uncharacterized protein G2W53_016238 [Senna tora]|uniref:Uncharacterized protein n=1 Tax=Senna tora TaxID=362788 RepID=A0A834TVL8_9FABA|nr:uncharacterized protein G2W53_016238 [Senna tora]
MTPRIQNLSKCQVKGMSDIYCNRCQQWTMFRRMHGATYRCCPETDRARKASTSNKSV